MEWKIKPIDEGKQIREYLQEVQGFSKRIMKALKYEGEKYSLTGIRKQLHLNYQREIRCRFYFLLRKRVAI